VRSVPHVNHNLSAFARIGSAAQSAAEGLIQTLNALGTRLSFTQDEDPLEELAAALRSWGDESAAAVINALNEAISSGNPVESSQVAQWVRIHNDDSPDERAAAVVDCIRTKPPENVTIIRRLSTAGSQKLVFLAKWHTTQSEIVLKRFIKPELAQKVIARELTAHALSLKHPNIIVTHLQHNVDGEPFLLENKLQEVLSDQWESHGIVEAANLLHDMANALEFLQGEGLVHGDLKPDNIGLEHGRYILLDFGICRPIEAFDAAEATGSLRTRAPELLIGGDSQHSYASDVWALGATVYRAFAHRFPLIGKDETVPRVSTPPERHEFERTLAARADKEYDEWVQFEDIPEPLKPVLRQMLLKDPTLRSTAKQVREFCRKNLAAVLREYDGQSKMAATDEIEKLCAYLPDAETLKLMPHHERHEAEKRLETLENKKGLSDDQKRALADIRRRFSRQ
jgi:serine/threonine protein kinase